MMAVALLAKLLFAVDTVPRKLFYFILMTDFILCYHSQKHKCVKNNSCNKVLFNLKFNLKSFSYFIIWVLNPVPDSEGLFINTSTSLSQNSSKQLKIVSRSYKHIEPGLNKWVMWIWTQIWCVLKNLNVLIYWNVFLLWRTSWKSTPG